jgi:putative phosphoesterase
VIVVLSDTHREEGHGLSGRARDAVADADRVLHAGDFTMPGVLDALQSASARLDAVYGNSDGPGVRERLPDARTVTAGGLSIAVTHRRGGGATGLGLFGRERGADLVVHGHTHRPALQSGTPALLNPGSHTSPRGGPPTHAELSVDGENVEVEVRTQSGDVVARGRVGGGNGG